jgi:hypothetical protein
MIFGSKYIVYIPWNLSKKTSSKSAQENLSKSAPNQLQISSKYSPNLVQETQQNKSPNDPNNPLFKSS